MARRDYFLILFDIVLNCYVRPNTLILNFYLSTYNNFYASLSILFFITPTIQYISLISYAVIPIYTNILIKNDIM